MEFLTIIINSFWFEVILKLLLGFLLSAVIGLERESLNKPAGFRTHTLIGVSAVLIMLCGEYMANKYDIDPTRLSSQLLSGIGFVGAGTILREGFNVKGLTTAASLLAIACIGLSIGAGFYSGGIITTVLVYIMLSYSHIVSRKLYKDNVFHMEIKTTNDVKEIIEKITTLSETNHISITQIKQTSATESKSKEIVVNFIGHYRGNVTKNELITAIATLDNVVEVIEHEQDN